MSILYLSYDGLTDPLGQSQILPYLLGLEKLGYSYYIISAEKEQSYQEHSERVNQLIKGRRIVWIPVKYHRRPPVLSTLYDLYRMSLRAGALAKHKKVKAVHCRSYLATLIGMRLKKKYAVPIIFDMRGFWADERVEGNLWKLNNPVYQLIYQFFKNRELLWLQKADFVISLTHAASAIMTSKLPETHATIKVIPCCADLEHFKPVSIKKENYMLYLGSLGTWYMLDEMLAFYKQASKEFHGLRFLILTKEPRSIVDQAALHQGLEPQSIEVREASREELPLLISRALFAVYFIRPGYSKKASSATKLGEILGCGVPVVTNTGVGDHELIFKDGLAGVLLSDFNESAYHEALMKLLPEKRSPQTLRLKAIEWFDLQKGIENYDSVYQKLGLN